MVDDVNLANAAPARFECETDVPVRLQSTAENGEGMYVCATAEEAGGGEGGAEGG